jgi:hypothetical protein
MVSLLSGRLGAGCVCARPSPLESRSMLEMWPAIRVTSRRSPPRSLKSSFRCSTGKGRAAFTRRRHHGGAPYLVMGFSRFPITDRPRIKHPIRRGSRPRRRPGRGADLLFRSAAFSGEEPRTSNMGGPRLLLTAHIAKHAMYAPPAAVAEQGCARLRGLKADRDVLSWTDQVIT